MGSRVGRVVTIGGGHGQYVALQAVLRLGLKPTAVPAVTDEGGCSGALRRSFGLPPPGDARRCLAAMATDPDRAERFERRGPPGDALVGRVTGNLLLAGFARRDGDLQTACDTAGAWLGACGRVTPAALSPMTLVGVDVDGRARVGELAIDASCRRIRSAHAQLGATPNPHAIRAIEEAEVVLLGPGSFFTSLIAALAAPGIAAALVRSSAKCIWLANLAGEGPQTAGMALPCYVASLREHVGRFAGRQLGELTVIAPGERHSASAVDPTTPLFRAPLRSGSGLVHDPLRLAHALRTVLASVRSERPTVRVGRAA